MRHKIKKIVISYILSICCILSFTIGSFKSHNVYASYSRYITARSLTVRKKASIKGKVAGYCIVYFVLDEGEIARIAVDTSCRRQGVGCKILNQVNQICVEKGITRLMLDVRESNESARKFYLSYGFQEDGIRKNFYDMPKEHAVLMSKDIAQ